ncbi:dynein regulatory complex protein 9-like isoform X2 [Maniola jurtina]|uniref:dynein regulatory complex protein 9-like isoform X2 n=1 Tax=Maniola jurtina TaxID=191418 RepID=UPI001E68EFE8|nr:dynein regulatory complex protein 9-like isoform X2 [Maniola jurtina]
MSTTRQKTLSSTVESVPRGRTSEFKFPIFLGPCASKTFCRNGECKETEIDEEQRTYKLSYFQACLFATVLEEIISQLRILDACNIQLRLNKTMSEMMVLLGDKYGIESKPTGDTLDDIDPKNLNCMKYKLNKLQADRDFILRVMTKTYQNLCIERDFQYLTDSVNEILRKYEHLYHLAEEELKNKMQRREANKQLRQLRNHIKSVTYDSNSEIESLRSQVEETLGKVENWIAKYETDMESIDLRIQVMKNDYESLQNKNQRLEETIKEHAESINNWNTFKNEREAARKHCEKMHNSAVIIQAWWRGLLVRNQLGPYKPVKKKGGASKSSEKSKKK